ncbi:Muniscin mu homology domain containing protein [Nitzschia inconspicua]|uniref:Muniscin mu homology domain containing protein n=1 Tax=Nitzschia inconspicua TaxID=303405 RepID=A0A9K3K7L5_9STRA|nr:Muniscin mu homology domain containing protein [Nitzschia inconspicua]KAG7362266.1 Muniscin mu homology domain containing protein [Nitzschia inconspicua]
MYLQHSQAVPSLEFASLSILHKTDISGGSLTCHIGEPLILPSPLSTFSLSLCMECLTELHLYINSFLKASSGNKGNNSNNYSSSLRPFLQDDESLILGGGSNKNKENNKSNNTNDVQIQTFRPQAGHGIALHYRLIRDRSKLSSVFPFVRNASKTLATSKNPAGLEKDVNALLLCVGMTGIPVMFGATPLVYSIQLRMDDCIRILSQHGPSINSESATVSSGDVSAAKSLLTTLLLTEDEDRMTNTMADAPNRLVLAEDEGAGSSGGGLLGTNRRKSTENNNSMGMAGEENPLLVNSADQARVIVERLAVLSVCESDTLFRKFEGRNKEAERGSGKKRLRKTTKDADLDGFDFRGTPRSSRNVISTSASLSGTTTTTLPSSESSVSMLSTHSSGSNLALKGPRKDTSSRVANKTPPLLRPSKDDARSRRATMGQQLGANSRDRNTGSRRSGTVGINGGASVFGSSTHSKQSVRSVQSDIASFTSRQSHSQASNQNFDPFQDIAEHNPDSRHGNDAMDISRNDFTAAGPAKVLVNVALNEDLTCFYKLSKMSSCSVEGVVQVQVKSNIDQGVPFFLLLRDPSKHIQSIQENRKFADSMADSLASEPVSTRPDYMFTISVPKADNYFPVMRYKCGSELRPVPIRVQTRVRMEDEHWRVALQISSNPHNEDNLTDLTIIMGVPPAVKGESLTTSPPGGVWNSSKRSVIWCVSELGGGEKFQLQAKFEVDPDAPKEVDGDKPKFPVLVRCQCMYAQLSDVEVDVRDIPQVVNADVKMKLARRFRLSHRERP